MDLSNNTNKYFFPLVSTELFSIDKIYIFKFENISYHDLQFMNMP
ncbi:Uncharacterised protein [Legionella geestiana]|nr:Uncharacterised protein [Legionella geestiana]